MLEIFDAVGITSNNSDQSLMWPINFSLGFKTKQSNKATIDELIPVHNSRAWCQRHQISLEPMANIKFDPNGVVPISNQCTTLNISAKQQSNRMTKIPDDNQTKLSSSNTGHINTDSPKRHDCCAHGIVIRPLSGSALQSTIECWKYLMPLASRQRVKAYREQSTSWILKRSDPTKPSWTNWYPCTTREHDANGIKYL
jgi:hypothetical protein